MNMIPMRAVGQEANLWLILKFNEDRSPMIPPRIRQQTDHDKSADKMREQLPTAPIASNKHKGCVTDVKRAGDIFIRLVPE
jgi:hypothetical protein